MQRNLRKLIGSVAVATTLAACSGQKQLEAEMTFENGLTPQEIEVGVLTPEVMWKMNRIGAMTLSPNGKDLVFAVTKYDMAENKGNSSLWLQSVEGGEPRRLTDHEGNDRAPQWAKDGRHIYFMTNRSGDDQLWVMNHSGCDMKQVSFVAGGIEAFKVSPDGTKAVYVAPVKVEKRKSSDIYDDAPKSKARIYDDLMARHWDYWDEGEYRHLFVADIKNDKFDSGIDILEGEPWDAPMAPYFDDSEFAWNHAGTQIAYTCKKMVGTQYATQTDSDIYVYDVARKSTININKDLGNQIEWVGYDKYPRFSPDDRSVVFSSMRRNGNESDKSRVVVIDLNNGQAKDLTRNFDYNAENITWGNDGKIYFIAPMQATHQVCSVDLNGEVSVITSGEHDINSMVIDSECKAGVVAITKLSMATELFDINLADGALKPLTAVNKEVYDNIKMGKVEKRWVKTTDNKDMLTWVVYPPDFDSTKRYPALLYCQGGPQSVVSQFWSYRWNAQLMAAQGYIVVLPNRRGLPSFGQEWLDQISGDYSGQNIKDYLSAIDNVSAEPFVDKERLGCVGASYGGYSVYFLAGHHDKRFKAFISHCGIFNFESMYGHTEELFFVNNDYGGSYWSENPVAKRSYANSPHKFVTKWDTPILIITGLNDFRIPYTQSLEAFTAARLQGIPSRLVAFEDEAHQVFKPQNSLVWNREFFGWLDQYVKNPDKK